MLSKVVKSFVVVNSLVAISFLFPPPSALAIGVGVTPSELNFNIRSGGSSNAVLYVINTGGNETRYKVYADEGWFSISPAEFSLAPQANREVQITASPPLFSLSNYSTYVYVVAVNPSSQLQVGTGIKVPIHIHMANWPLWIAIGVAAALLVALIISLTRRRRKDEAN